MQNIPDVHAHDIEIPTGKVKLAEYGDIGPDDRRATSHVLDTKTGWGDTEVKLIAREAGFEIAGSMMRWTNGHFAIEYWFQGSRHGRRFKTFPEALEAFNRIPATR